MRPRTPALNLGQSIAGGRPTSPPETPTTVSPTLHRARASIGNMSPQAKALQYSASRSNLRPLGGNKFSYSREPRPAEISPRSSHSSDEESDESESPPRSPLPDIPAIHIRSGFQFTTAFAALATRTIHYDDATFALEDLNSDTFDSDDGNFGLSVRRPDAIEYEDDSDDSQTPPNRPPDRLADHMANMTPFISDTDSDIDDDDEFRRSLLLRRQDRRIRRMKSGSISKRTVSERGSDGSDREDVDPWSESHEHGVAFHRRVRRKAENRMSLISTVERIEELKEPNSDEEIEHANEAELSLRELPYFTFMEVDSE
ncbi:hypothetical protein F5Y18DRAFT_338961 [Xylariaceae sp. FL1019]|nr:hypothetical protein F5Y18DRAFT_338961 [Xylariaceae sp. FL1019]